MSELNRLKRMALSWWGGVTKNRRPHDYQADDARMIVNDLGLQLSAEGLTSIADNSFRREDMLVQLYNAEEALNIDLIKDNMMIDPIYEPKVYELEGHIVITATVDGEEVVIVEFEDKNSPPGL